jgi:CubicO group peptidase (beta-lactamase class C family)
MKKWLTILLLTASLIRSTSQSLYFPPVLGNTWETLSPESLNWCQWKIDSLYAYLEANNTKAFIVLKGGKIVLEKYFGTHTQSTAWQWASAGKTITSFMIGIAQQERKLSIQDPTSKYLGKGWTDCTPTQEDKITIRHQLTMTSGLDDGVGDPYCTLDTCLRYKADAGTRWAYHNGPYTLLDQVIEAATGMTLNTYATQKLKIPTGMTGAFFQVGYNNVYFSTARSMARFGLLILNQGKWGETAVMTDTAYFRQMVNTSQNINLSYGYLWWLNGKQGYMLPGPQTVFNGFFNINGPADMIVAMGRDGQFLNVVPSQQLVMLRMGNAPSSLPVPAFMNNEIWKYLNNLECGATRVRERQQEDRGVKVFPNPAKQVFTVQAQDKITSVQIFHISGQLLQQVTVQGNAQDIPIDDLPKGLYLVKIWFEDGLPWLGKVLKG